MKSIFAVVLCLVSAVAARGVVVERNDSIVYFSTNVYLFDDLTTPVHERIGESASNAFVNGDPKLLVGATNESLIRRIYAGNQNQATLPNVGMAIDDAITNVVSGLSIGGYFDASTLWVTGRVSYSSFASHFGMNGTNDYNNPMAFYAAPALNTSGHGGEYSTLVHYPRIEDGIWTNVSGVHIYNLRSYSGLGTNHNQYGLFIEELTAGKSNNYAVYTYGTTPSYFGGPVQIVGNLVVPRLDGARNYIGQGANSNLFGIYIGAYAGSGTTTGTMHVALGEYAGRNANGTNIVSIGPWSGTCVAGSNVVCIDAFHLNTMHGTNNAFYLNDGELNLGRSGAFATHTNNLRGSWSLNGEPIATGAYVPLAGTSQMDGTAELSDGSSYISWDEDLIHGFHVDGYLPLDGGTIDGDVTLTNMNSLVVGTVNGANPLTTIAPMYVDGGNYAAYDFRHYFTGAIQSTGTLYYVSNRFVFTKGIAVPSLTSRGTFALEGDFVSDPLPTNSYPNLLIGTQAGGSRLFTHTTGTTGWKNYGIGYQTLNAAKSAGNTIAIGHTSLKSTTNGSDLVAVGHYTLAAAISATGQVAIGDYSLQKIKGGAGNVSIGYMSMSETTNANCENNVAIGVAALKNVGSNSGNIGENTAVGAYSLTLATSGYHNTAVGSGSLDALISGYGNVAFGQDSGGGNVSGHWNTYLGEDTALNHTNGNRNVFVGAEIASTLHNGSNNVCIGYGSDVPAEDTSNWISISGTITGDSSIQSIAVGSGTNAPRARLDVNGDAMVVSNLYLHPDKLCWLKSDGTNLYFCTSVGTGITNALTSN